VDAWRLAVVLKYTRLGAFRLSQDGPQEFRLQVAARAPDTGDDAGDLVGRLRQALTALGWDRPRVRLGPLDQEAGPAKPSPFQACWSRC